MESEASRSITYNRGTASGSQPWQSSAQPPRKHTQNDASGSKPKNSWNKGTTKKKSVKFAGLSEKDMAQLRAEGRCFFCREIGHLSRNCPRKNSMPGNGKNKPPGVPSYSMEMTVIESTEDASDVLDSMPLGSINIETNLNIEPVIKTENDDWRKWWPIWQNPASQAQDPIGDCYAMTAEFLLTKFQLYPGDEYGMDEISEIDKDSDPVLPYDRFRVKRTSGNTDLYRINDCFTGFSIVINKSSLANPKFNLAHWYALNRTKNLKLGKPSTGEYPLQLVNPVALVTKSVLQSGVHSHFPNVLIETWTTDFRFFVYLKDYGSTTYVIVNDDLKLEIEIDVTILENPKFDLVGWYLEYITRDKIFYKQ
jgi:hypothetical protein